MKLFSTNNTVIIEYCREIIYFNLPNVTIAWQCCNETESVWILKKALWYVYSMVAIAQYLLLLISFISISCI